MTGYIAAPAAIVNVNLGEDIVLMYFGKSMNIGSISPSDAKLSVSDKDGICEVELADLGGRLAIACTTAGTGFRSVRVELTRTPAILRNNLYVRQMFLTDVLAEFEKDSLNFEWQPVTRKLEEDFLIAFRPFALNEEIGFGSFTNTIFAILKELGIDPSAFSSQGDPGNDSLWETVALADGPLTRYQIAVVIDRPHLPDIWSRSTLYLQT